MIKNRSNAEHYVWGTHCDGWRLLDRSDLSVIQERIPPNLGEIRHYHQRARQLFFVLDGTLTIEIADHQHELHQGDSIEVEPMREHQIRNLGTVDATFLVVSAPTTAGDRVNV